MPAENHSSRLGSWWRRRAVAPIARQLTQGVAPAKLALALSVGAVIAINPFLGTTTLGCIAVGLALGLNQPVMQIANLLASPLQLALIVPWVRAGGWLYGAAPISVNPALIARDFAASPARFLVRFGATGLYAATAWAIAAIPLGLLLYVVLCRVIGGLTRSHNVSVAAAASGADGMMVCAKQPALAPACRPSRSRGSSPQL